jgi:chondroitin sulfate synthase
VFRAIDRGLVHVFHPVHCDPALDAAQYQMCLGSKAATLASTRRLGDIVLRTPDILNRNENAESPAGGA